MNLRLPSLTVTRFSRDAKLLMAVLGIFSMSNMGVQVLLKVLYVLRLGYGPEYIGLFNASSALAYTAMSLPGGILGERFGTRKVMLTGGVIMIFGMAVFPLAEFLPSGMRPAWLIASQVVLTTGWAAITVNVVPALMCATTAQDRAGSYAACGAFRSLGTLLGTVGGGLLPGLFAGILGQTLDAPRPYAYALWVSAALGLIGLIPALLVREVQPARAVEGTATHEPFPFLPFALLAVHVFLDHGGWATCQAFCNAYMDTDLHLPAYSIGLIAGAAQFAAFMAAFLVPRLSARHGHGLMLVVASLGTGICLLPLALFPHWTAAAVGRVGVYAVDALWMPALQMFQMEQVVAQWRSRAYGAISMVMGFSFATMSLGGGYIIAASGYRSVFSVGAGLCAAGATALWVTRRQQDASQAKASAPVPQKP